MPRLSLPIRLLTPARWPLAAAHSARATRSAHDSLFRRASVEPLENRWALDAAASFAAPTPFIGADSARQVEVAADTSSHSSGDSEPQLFLAPLDHRPVAASIDRIQATAIVGPFVDIEPRSLLPRVDAGSIDETGRISSPAQLQQSLPRTEVSEASGATAARAGVSAIHRGTRDEPPPETAQPQPPRRFLAAAPEPIVDSATAIEKRSITRPPVAKKPAPLPVAAAPARIFAQQARSPAVSELDRPSTGDGRAYLTDIQSTIFMAAAAATALVLPGIVAEIRRRRRKPLPRMTPDLLSASDRTEANGETPACTLPLRERAG